MSAVCDFVCYAEFMWHGGRCQPRKLYFVSVLDPTEMYCVKVTDASLTAFSQDDIAINMTLPINPHLPGPEPYGTVEVALEDLQEYLRRHIMEGVLNRTGYPSTVGCVDTATFYELRHTMHDVLFLGSALMGERSDALGEHPDGLEICRVAAEKMHTRRQASTDPYWDDV